MEGRSTSSTSGKDRKRNFIMSHVVITLSAEFSKHQFRIKQDLVNMPVLGEGRGGEGRGGEGRGGEGRGGEGRGGEGRGGEGRGGGGEGRRGGGEGRGGEEGGRGGEGRGGGGEGRGGEGRRGGGEGRGGEEGGRGYHYSIYLHNSLFRALHVPLAVLNRNRILFCRVFRAHH